MSDDKRCGTCKLWGDDGDREQYRNCYAEIPHSVLVEQIVRVSEYEGTTCPCWEAKE